MLAVAALLAGLLALVLGGTAFLWNTGALGGAFGSAAVASACMPVNTLLWILVGLFMVGPAAMVLYLANRIKQVCAVRPKTREPVVIEEARFV